MMYKDRHRPAPRSGSIGSGGNCFASGRTMFSWTAIGLFELLASEARLSILGTLAKSGQAGMTTTHLSLRTGLRPRALRRHLDALIESGLVRRQRTGQGCRVDASLMQAALDLQAESLVAWANAPARPPTTQALRHVAGWYYAAPYGVYATQDGHLALSLTPLKTLAEVLDEPRLADFSEKDTWSRQDEITDLIAQRLKTAVTSEWVARMEPLKIWHAPVQDYAQIAEDPQVKHMGSFVTVAGTGNTGAPLTLVNHPVHYDGESAEVRLPPQQLGAQTEEVLAQIGLDASEIAALADANIIKLHRR